MKKKLLITGGSGLLGINWALTCKDNFEVILGLNRRIVGIPGVRTEKLRFDSLSHLTQDFKRIKADIVINAAALTNVDECEKNFSLAKNVNTTLASEISIICNSLGTKLVQISTDHFFSNDTKFYNENDKVDLLNNYAKTKHQAELEVMKNHPSSLIVRTNFFGWGTQYRQSFSDFIISKLN